MTTDNSEQPLSSSEKQKLEHEIEIKFRNQGYNDCLYNLVGKFTMNEMDTLEEMMNSPEVPDMYRYVLSDIHHNYNWLHHEYVDSIKDFTKDSTKDSK